MEFLRYPQIYLLPCILLLFEFQTINCLQILSTEEKSCKVITDKGGIDLTPLANTDGTPRFTKHTSDQGGPTYLWNPCNNFNTGDNCKNVEVCEEFGLYSTALGAKGQSNFTVEGEKLILQYKNDPYTVKIQLVCGTDNKDVLKLGTSSQYWTWTLTSKHACYIPVPTSPPPSKGLSVGSVLCIILLVVVVLYIPVGFVFMKVRKVSYKELHQYKLCTVIACSAKDGVIFVFRCCKPLNSTSTSSSKEYDSI